jgi:hypothetical protein
MMLGIFDIGVNKNNFTNGKSHSLFAGRLW